MALSTTASGATTASTEAADRGASNDDELFDHEAATICATPMLLQLRRALLLSWRTKLGGNRRIGAEKTRGAPPTRRRKDACGRAPEAADPQSPAAKAARETREEGKKAEETAIGGDGGRRGSPHSSRNQEDEIRNPVRSTFPFIENEGKEDKIIPDLRHDLVSGIKLHVISLRSGGR